MSHKSTVISKIVGKLHPGVAAQAAEIICQMLIAQGKVELPTGNQVKNLDYYIKGKQLLTAVQTPNSPRLALAMVLNEGQLEFFEYEWQFPDLIKEVEGLWGQVYTACAIAAALQMQGKQVEVKPTPQGQIQVIGIGG